MQIRKTTHNWAIAGAVAAMLAASTAGVRAQDATMPATPAPSGTSTSGDMSSTSMAGGMSSGSMSGGTMDYSILSNPNYDYVDLEQAKARGLSDDQIATIAKIAIKSGRSFSTVSRAVQRGETFPALAAEYNLRLGDVYSADKEKQQIADYISTYESIDTKNGSSGMDMSSGSNMGTTTGNMSGTDSTTDSSASSSMSTTTSTSSNMATMDIVDTAMAAKNLTTLVKALQVAGLVETLKGTGPFTVFAPSDQAFARLPAGQLDALMADPARLKTILTYHVIPARIMASDALAMTSPTSPPTVQGGTLQVTKGRRGRVMVNDVTVT
ncbi:MAG: fasciclin domain-containing protein, partial [Armatimonadota bacterium]|nr:fasciclin domain-containing protein [Armatimonadota bacterium]